MRKKNPSITGRGEAALPDESVEEPKQPPGRREVLDAMLGPVASSRPLDWDVLMVDGRLDLGSALQIFLHYHHSPWIALEALAKLAGPVWAAAPDDADRFSGLPPQETVEVPWWVVQSLAAAWLRHVHGYGERRWSIGEALGLKASGKGSRAPYKRSRQDQKMMGFALDVAGRLARREETKVEGAVAACAGEHRISQETVWNAWRRYRGPAKTMAFNIYTQPPCK
jgi:hypothetical protein